MQVVFFFKKKKIKGQALCRMVADEERRPARGWSKRNSQLLRDELLDGSADRNSACMMGANWVLAMMHVRRWN